MYVNEDDFTRSQDLSHARWVAVLSDGTEYVEDDGREKTSAWLRLKRYLAGKSLSLVGIKLRFRANEIVAVPPNKAGYFFRKSLLSDINTGEVAFFYLVGWRENQTIYVRKYLVPSLDFMSEEQRSFADMDESYLEV